VTAVTMADLGPGTRVRHARTGIPGTVTVDRGWYWIRWRGGPVAEEGVSDAGPVFPSDVEILREES
jgi:hypothetical protein